MIKPARKMDVASGVGGVRKSGHNIRWCLFSLLKSQVVRSISFSIAVILALALNVSAQINVIPDVAAEYLSAQRLLQSGFQITDKLKLEKMFQPADAWLQAGVRNQRSQNTYRVWYKYDGWKTDDTLRFEEQVHAFIWKDSRLVFDSSVDPRGLGDNRSVTTVRRYRYFMGRPQILVVRKTRTIFSDPIRARTDIDSEEERFYFDRRSHLLVRRKEYNHRQELIGEDRIVYGESDTITESGYWISWRLRPRDKKHDYLLKTFITSTPKKDSSGGEQFEAGTVYNYLNEEIRSTILFQRWRRQVMKSERDGSSKHEIVADMSNDTIAHVQESYSGRMYNMDFVRRTPNSWEVLLKAVPKDWAARNSDSGYSVRVRMMSTPNGFISQNLERFRFSFSEYDQHISVDSFLYRNENWVLPEKR